VAPDNQLSPGGAFVMGSLFIACGIPAILIGLGVIAPAASDAPGWVATALGLMFSCAGAAIIVDYGIGGGLGPAGDFKPGTPLSIRVANLALGLAIVGLMASVFGWVAFGPGPRQFTSTLTLPFMPLRWRSGEWTGRAAFGAFSILLVVMFIACGVSGVQRLRRGLTNRST
jgi:hypothetical protein